MSKKSMRLSTQVVVLFCLCCFSHITLRFLRTLFVLLAETGDNVGVSIVWFVLGTSV